MRIPDAHVDRAAYVIDTSGAADLLQEAIALAPQGQRKQLPMRSWLIGAYLAIEHAASFKSTTIHRVLTDGISIRKQYELGARFQTAAGTAETIKKSRVDYYPRNFKLRLSYTSAAAKRWKLDIEQDEMSRRRKLVEQAVFQLLTASIVLNSNGWYAIDGSSVWSWGRSKYAVKDDHDVRTDEEVHDVPPEDERTTDGVVDAGDADDQDGSPDNERTPDAVADGVVDAADTNDQDDSGLPTGSTTKSRKVVGNHDPDAAVGTKTSKFGKRESYYGYVLDAAIRVQPPGAPKQPVVIEYLLLSPASTDVVEPTLKMLDALMTTVGGVTDIVVDRHYSYKRPDRWADELVRRGIVQHFDLRSDEQGFKDVNGMRLVAGWMHCPATPDELADIPRPGPGASDAEKAEFRHKINERFTWALDRHERVNKDGRSRWKCPAVAMKRGCPLREGTVATAKSYGLPIVENPPDLDTAPTCCTNASGIVSDKSDAMRKHQQPHYWGSEQWQIAYDLRTYVEGLFGSLKNPDTEGVRRGFTKYVGLPMLSLGIGLAAAVCNVRHQRQRWVGAPDCPDHPLLQADPPSVGWMELTPEQAAALDELHSPDQGDAASAA